MLVRATPSWRGKDVNKCCHFKDAWPPHVWIAINALLALLSNVTNSTFDDFAQNVISYSYLPPNHFGIPQSALPQQNIFGSNADNLASVAFFTELGNVGNVTGNGLSWRDGL